MYSNGIIGYTLIGRRSWPQLAGSAVDHASIVAAVVIRVLDSQSHLRCTAPALASPLLPITSWPP